MTPQDTFTANWLEKCKGFGRGSRRR
jgi:hypothetical protein